MKFTFIKLVLYLELSMNEMCIEKVNIYFLQQHMPKC